MQKKLNLCDIVLDLKRGQCQNERYVAHLQWLYNWLAPSMCKYVKRFGWVAHTKYHPSHIKYADKLSFVWPRPESEMRSRSKLKVSCTSTMIVQLIGTKYVQICEAVGLSRANKVPPVFGTDRCTDTWTWIICPPVWDNYWLIISLMYNWVFNR